MSYKQAEWNSAKMSFYKRIFFSGSKMKFWFGEEKAWKQAMFMSPWKFPTHSWLCSVGL